MISFLSVEYFYFYYLRNILLQFVILGMYTATFGVKNKKKQLRWKQ